MTKVQLGCGPNILDGWINIDLIDNPKILKHDLRTKLPFENNSVDFFFSEAFFEHLTKEDGINLLREIFRCLKPGGVSRIGTPDLAYLVKCYIENNLRGYEPVGFITKSRCELVNRGMRDWGHLYLYDKEEFLEVHRLAGFTKYELKDHRVSKYPELNKIEVRPFTEEMICEATK